MEIKLFEVRDRATFITCFGIKTKSWHERERYLLGRCGYGAEGDAILFGRLDGSGRAYSDAYDWSDRTHQVAHLYVQQHWDELETGEVIDVEFILEETTQKKVSEQEEGW